VDSYGYYSPLFMLHDLISSFLLVTLAEMGDKTQILAAILAARFRRAWPIIGGVFVATLLNHAGAAYIGKLLADHLHGNIMNIITGVVFIALGFWLLIPDKAPDGAYEEKSTSSAFWTSLIAFFLAEMGDKTQIATISLGAHIDSTIIVIVGTTLGMMAANIPAVFFGETLLKKIPMDTFRKLASSLFIIYGLCAFFM
jgi:putative Ca2+/H+ antiporter (TMEM165/GDT1 family)